jgi:phytoene dehydrogenase-like protein
MAHQIIEKFSRYAPNFKDVVIRNITFAPYHGYTMFGAPNGDFCHGLLQPELMGPNRPGPRGFVDEPIPIRGLYLGGAGCHRGPGITFIPGYNAGHQVFADVGK